MLQSVFKMSSVQKLNDGSIFLLRGNRYMAVDLTSWLESVAMMDYEYKIGVLNLSEPEIRRFLKKRGLYTGKDFPPVKDDISYYDGRQGLVYVLSNEKVRQGIKKPYHRIKLWDFLAPPESAYESWEFTEDEKIRSARNFMVNCPCGRVDFQSTCRAPESWRKFYSDYRYTSFIPSPSNTMVLDRHGFTAVQYGVIFYGFYDFGIFGFPEEVMEDMKSAIKKQLRTKDRINNFFLNPILAKSTMVNPWAELIKFAYNLDLSEMLH